MTVSVCVWVCVCRRPLEFKIRRGKKGWQTQKAAGIPRLTPNPEGSKPNSFQKFCILPGLCVYNWTRETLYVCIYVCVCAKLK